MFRVGIIIVGLLIVSFGLFGMYNAYVKIGKPPVEKSDMVAEAVITNIYVDQTVHRLTNVVLTSTCKIDYSFIAADGKKYNDTEILEEDQIRSLSVGQTLPIQYNSNNPWICASEYGSYLPVDAYPDTPPETCLMNCLMIFGFGAVLLLLTIVCKDDEKAEKSKIDSLANMTYNYSA